MRGEGRGVREPGAGRDVAGEGRGRGMATGCAVSPREVTSAKRARARRKLRYAHAGGPMLWSAVVSWRVSPAWLAASAR
jgi:hypothetical protein